MNIKDFKVGEKAYLVEDGEVKAVEIKKVGRKYVSIKYRRYSFSLQNETDNHLADNSWGSKVRLFLREQDAIDVLDKNKLILEIRRSVDWCSCKLSVDQLRRISAIINEVKL